MQEDHSALLAQPWANLLQAIRILLVSFSGKRTPLTFKRHATVTCSRGRCPSGKLAISKPVRHFK
jgi:hypothetical protein